MRLNSFLRCIPNRGFFGLIQEVTDPLESHPYTSTRQIGVYSAAAVNAGFALADDTMKSEMRGTISDLKRDPLNTP